MDDDGSVRLTPESAAGIDASGRERRPRRRPAQLARASRELTAMLGPVRSVRVENDQVVVETASG